MTVQDYFELLGYDHHSTDQFFFVKAKAIKSETSPSLELYYSTTPVNSVSDWWGCDGVMDAIVLNVRAFAPEVISVNWNDGVLSGRTKALLIISQKEFEAVKNGMPTIEYLDKKIMEAIKDEIGKHAKPRKEGIDSVYCKEQPRMLALIRKILARDGAVKVVNQYETFYGVGFDRWLRNGLADIPCDIEVISVNPWEGYPWSYRITVKDIDELAGGAPSPKRRAKAAKKPQNRVKYEK